ERGRAQRDEHEVPRVRGDTRDDPEQHDDEGQRALRRDADQPAYQRGYQPGRLRETDADHHDEHDRDGREVPEVVDERREEIAAAVTGEKALHLRRHRLDVVRLGRLGLGRPDVHRLDRAAEVLLLRRDGWWLDDLEGRLDIEPKEDLRDDD